MGWSLIYFAWPGGIAGSDLHVDGVAGPRVRRRCCLERLGLFAILSRNVAQSSCLMCWWALRLSKTLLKSIDVGELASACC